MSKFKNANGVYFINDLFYETAMNKDNVLFTLKLQDHMGYPSLYRLYMESDDPTEYQFAVKHLDGWQHWKRLASSPILRDHVAEWREELEIRTRSEALAGILITAAGETKESFQAQKYITDGNYLGKEPAKRGRPSKKEIGERANEIASESKRIESEYLRLVPKS